MTTIGISVFDGAEEADAALHLVARLAGKDRAREVGRYAQYDPRPPV